MLELNDRKFRRMNIKNFIWNYLILSLIISTAFLTGCDEDFPERRFDEDEEEMQIYDYLKTRPDLSVYKEICDYSGFYSTVSTAGTYTVFIPNNEAFQNLFTRLKISGYKDKTPEYWMYYMKYHALEKKINTNSFNSGEITEHTMMGDAYKLTADVTSYVAIKLNNTATIIDSLSNIDLRNGYANVIDEVINPPISTIYDILKEHGGYSRMLKLFEDNGYKSYLTDSLITLLVEPDIAFDRENPKFALNPDTISNIKDWLDYHILPGDRYFINNLKERTLQSLYTKDVTTFNYFDNRLWCNQKDYLSSLSDYPIDVNALNGVLHSMEVPLKIRQHTAGKIRYNLYGRTNPKKGYELNVFADPPAFISEDISYSSFHQGSKENRQPPTCKFHTTQAGDAFTIHIPDVVPGHYTVRMIYYVEVCTNVTMEYKNDVFKNIQLKTKDGDFAEFTSLKYKNCGEIEVNQYGTVTLKFIATEVNDLIMDMIELDAKVSFYPEYDNE